MATDHDIITLSQNQLLQQEYVESAAYQLEALSGLPFAHFELFYQAPLGRFLSLSQHCTERELSAQFDVVVKHLKLRRSMILPSNADAESISRLKDLWTYAVFTGSLMYRAEELVFRKVLYRPNGSNDKFKKWSPFNGAITPGYDLKVAGKLDIVESSATLLLPLVFCNRCLAWLSREPTIMNNAIILSHSPQLCDLGRHLFEKMKAATMNKPPLGAAEHAQWTTRRQRNEGNNPQRNGHMLASTDANAPPTFRQWLKDKIQRGELQSAISKMEEGYAVADPEVFIQYAKQCQVEDWQHERQVFLSAQLHKTFPKVIFSGGVKKKAFLIDTIGNDRLCHVNPWLKFFLLYIEQP